MKKTYIPVLHRIVVRVLEDNFKKEDDDVKTEGGIIIPNEVRRRELGNRATGIVMAVGITAFEAYGAPNDHVKPGDKVLFQFYAGLEKSDEDDYIRIIKYVDVISKIEEE